LDPRTRAALQLLPELYGGVEVLDAAEKKLPKLPELAGRAEDAARARQGHARADQLRSRRAGG